MYHLSIIIADLGRFAHLRGTVGRVASTCIVIEDHRLSMHERVRFITDHIDMDEVTGIDVTVLTDTTPNCTAGVHEWRVATLTDTDIETCCVHCGACERAPRLPYWTGAVLRAPRLPLINRQETLDHGMG